FRHAIVVDGFEPVDGSPLPNDGPMATSFKTGGDKLCSYTSVPGEREEWPLTCASWFTARAFCPFYGGDLRTESECAYVAAAPGRTGETAYPTGDAPPSCDAAVHARAQASDVPIGSAKCIANGFGPASVIAGSGDTTANGVAGMAGSASEWLLDGYASYASVC